MPVSRVVKKVFIDPWPPVLAGVFVTTTYWIAALPGSWAYHPGIIFTGLLLGVGTAWTQSRKRLLAERRQAWRDGHPGC